MSSIRSVALIVVVVLASSVTGWSQVRDKELLDRLETQLDALSRDIAQEYLDILESLQDVIDDYANYMTATSADAVAHRVEGVERIQRKLEQKAYVDNPEALLEDLNSAINDIKAIETAHRVKFNSNSPSCCRLGRSLRKELVIIAELVEDYSEKQSDRVLKRDETKKYLEAASKYLAALKQAKGSAKMTGEIRQALEALRALGLDDFIVLDPDELDVPEVPDVPEILELPETPEPIKPPKPPLIIFSPRTGKDAGKRGAQHEAHGQISVSNSSFPIVVENPSGDVYISGTSDKTVTANLSFEVSASTHAKEQEYIERTLLVVEKESNQYTVRIDLPRLSDHRTELLNCVLEVSVPRANPIDCQSAFGQVAITDISGKVSVSSSNSQVTVERASGGASVSNSMGPVEMLDINGDLEVKNSYAPVSITSCTGTMLLENQYSSITLSRTEGRVDIGNTGQIEIVDHTGNIVIENLYGAVDADNIRGDVIVKSGYQPIRIKDISGSAELENQYAEISAKQVGGSVSITNQYAPIFVESSDGPVDLSNYYSNINIDLARGFLGGSTISNTEGSVNVTVVQQPNLVIAAYAERGNISSSLPLSVKTRGDSKSGELVLGEGGDRLEITTSGGAIIIRGR
ncbi:MAG: hypothetical protein NTW07_08245 [candidate division Zixibacteria bacterium]|nr:hypothetical protein [candidate division Zixibacteria bacterium]